jgi:hypothetical protein
MASRRAWIRFNRSLAARRALQAICALSVAATLTACVQGDFGRIPRTLVRDDMHDWIGPTALAGEPGSNFPLSSDERLLRDLAYPLITPPYEHGRIGAVLHEYGINSPPHPGMFDRQAYAANLLGICRRSPVSAYSQLIDDVRNDITRMPQFFAVAARVRDLDEKRRKSLFYIAAVSEPERANAIQRVRENAAVIGWVRASFAERAVAYRFALERLVVTAPNPMAVEGEQTINHLRERTAFYSRHLPPPWQRERSLARAD